MDDVGGFNRPRKEFDILICLRQRSLESSPTKRQMVYSRSCRRNGVGKRFLGMAVEREIAMNPYFFDVVVENCSDAEMAKVEFEQWFRQSRSVKNYDINQQEIHGLSAMEVVISFSLNLVSGISIHLFRNEIDQAYQTFKSKLKKPLRIEHQSSPNETDSQSPGDGSL